MGVENLQLEAGGDGEQRIGDSHEDTRIPPLLKFEVEFEHEIAVLALGHDVVGKAFPAVFTLTGFDSDYVAWLDHPVSSGVPSSQILAIEQRGEFRVLVLGVIGLVDAFGLNWLELGFSGDSATRHQRKTEAMR